MTESLHHEDCPGYKDWPKMKDQVVAAINKIDAMHSLLQAVSIHITHLSKLDQIASTLDLFTERLLTSATDRGRDITKWLVSALLLIVVILLVREAGYDFKANSHGVSVEAPRCGN
jgi:hypothetical protein